MGVDQLMIEPVPAEVYIQPDNPSSAQTSWVVIAASVQGTGHVRRGVPCQDAHAYRAVSDSFLIAAVADGLGSASRAETGSRLAVDSVLRFLEDELSNATPADEQAWIALVQAGFLHARARLQEQAAADQAELREYATTLLVAIIAGGWLVTAHIGDGACVSLLEDNTLVMVSSPQNEEYANVTFPLTMDNMLAQAQFQAFQQKVSGLALMTDGVQNAAIRTIDQAPHGPFFLPLFRQLPGVRDPQKASRNLAEFLGSPQVSARTDDDKTLMLIGRRIEN